MGAGVLALPAKTLAAGFVPSSGALFLCWVYMAASGLLIAEVNVNTLCATPHHRRAATAAAPPPHHRRHAAATLPHHCTAAAPPLHAHTDCAPCASRTPGRSTPAAVAP